jgi:hypothetical protein
LISRPIHLFPLARKSLTNNVKSRAWRVIAERFGVSESTAGRYVLLARKADHLPPTKPGKKNA